MKKKSTTLFKVQYQFDGETTIYETIATSAGLASIDADPYAVILNVTRL